MVEEPIAAPEVVKEVKNAIPQFVGIQVESVTPLAVHEQVVAEVVVVVGVVFAKHVVLVTVPEASVEVVLQLTFSTLLVPET